MIDVKLKCIDCDHCTMCKYSEDYIEFCSRLSDLANKLDGKIIAEGVAHAEIKCKFFKPITRTPRSSFDLNNLKQKREANEK